MNLDQSHACPPKSVRNEYLQRLAEAAERVNTFQNEGGYSLVCSIARNPEQDNDEKLDKILGLRLSANIPTLEPLGIDEHGGIRLGYKRHVTLSSNQKAQFHEAFAG